MVDWILLANFSLDVAALMLMLICLFSVSISRDLERWSRRFFRVFFSVLILYIACNLLSIILGTVHDPGYTTSTKLAVYFESLFSALLMPLLALYLLHCAGENWRKSPLLSSVSLLFLIYFVLLTVTQFTTFIYYYTPDNVYHRGPWYPVLLVIPIVTMLLLLAALLRRKDRLTRKQFTAFLLYLLLPMLGMLVQMCFFGLYTIVFGSTLAATFMYVFIHTDQVEQHVRRQEEIARQRASIMVLQMRPHFIYNTLLSIYYLCQQDAKKAQQVILDFSSYLRQNFTAIVKEDTIPFSEELEHTRSYLAVEQVRFEDRLYVTYNTPATRFRIPPLTLQPIVENAVKHGIDPELGPLKIHIETRETEKGHVIIVTDNGPGYVPVNDNEPHIALNNIRERLELMCGGTLDICSGKVRGTVVTITIPERSEQA